MESFIYDLTDILKQLDCPYQCLITGPIETRLAGRNKLVVLSFLASELQGWDYIILITSKKTENLNRTFIA